MSKARFFITEKAGESVTITGPDVKHIKDVLRLGAGAVIEVVDSTPSLCEVEVEHVSRDAVTGRVLARHEPVMTAPQVYLFQGLPKAGKIDVVVRQATELGVAGVTPVLTERVVVEFESGKAEKKSIRRQKIAEEAAKQSHRLLVPKVGAPLDWESALRELAGFDQVVVFWEGERDRLLSEVLKPEAARIALVVGPEGGLSEREIVDLKALGAGVASMGEYTLRTETAGPIAVALTLYEYARTRRDRRKP
ncbi:MAG: 16S rRNA (uracil(1498)-N(3))-methyltransferase [Actinobacteria bacterium]|nr:16S rRNA (uracil(1498)-N(3))-methyltransferase [Actinomycetota bacterium]